MAGLNKLRAVNIALENIGESPVNTLTDTGDVYVSTAESILEETARDVCEEVWNFNTDYDYDMVPDVNGNILITDDMIAVDGHERTDDYAVRQGKLYDRENQTFVFTETQALDIVWEFEFDDCPQHVRKYIAIRAARVFARRQIGDVTGERLSEQDELRARATAKRHDTKNRDKTVFHDYHSGLYRLKNRRIR
jgi:hypothetical protein